MLRHLILMFMTNIHFLPFHSSYTTDESLFRDKKGSSNCFGRYATDTLYEQETRIKRCSRRVLHAVGQEQAKQLLALPIRQGNLQLEMERVLTTRPLHYPTTNQGGVEGNATQHGHDQVRMTIRKVSHDVRG